jgi:hypothetical protein
MNVKESSEMKNACPSMKYLSTWSLVLLTAALPVSGFAQPQYGPQIDNTCRSNGAPRHLPVTCGDCHSNMPATTTNANTPFAAQWKAGNVSAFCPLTVAPREGEGKVVR